MQRSKLAKGAEDKCFAMRGEAAVRDRENRGPRARRRWLGKLPNGQDHAIEDKPS
jgi:hypothetical protein